MTGPVLICVVFCILLISKPCFPQNDPDSILIESSGFKMVAHMFSGNTNSPRPTVILVPGWGGGKKDVLGLGSDLSQLGINVVVFAPRGWHDSEGTATFANGLEDIAAVWRWSQLPENVEPLIFTPLGYPADVPGTKERKPLSELVRYL